MKRLKPMAVAAIASICMLFAVSVYAQPAQPEAPAVIDAGQEAPALDPAPADAEAPAATTEAPAVAEAPVNPAAENPTGFAKEVWAKYKSREWLPLVGGMLLMLVFVFRKFASKISKFFDTKKGGYIVNFSTAGGVTLGIALWAGEGFSMGLVWIAIGSAIVASGGYEHLRDFVGALFAGKPALDTKPEDLT